MYRAIRLTNKEQQIIQVGGDWLTNQRINSVYLKGSVMSGTVHLPGQGKHRVSKALDETFWRAV